MKIGVNTLFMIPGQVGGAQIWLEELLSQLASRPEHDLHLFTQKNNHQHLQALLPTLSPDQFHLLPFDAMSRVTRILREQIELPGRVGKSGVDVLWSAGYTPCLRSPVAQLLSIHDMQYKRFPEDLAWRERVVLDFLVQQGVRHCKRVSTLTEFSRNELLRFTSVSPDKISVVPGAVDEAFAVETDREVLNDHLDVSTPWILCVANSYPHKNLPLAIRAFHQLADEFPHQLILVGKPRRGEDEVQRALTEHPSSSTRIHRLTDLSRLQLIALYQHADVFAFPSRYEGFGLPVLEAMMAGTPVVSTREASIPEVAGKQARLVKDSRDPGEFALLLRQALTTQADPEAARVHARRYGWAQAADALVTCLETACDAD